MKTLLSVMLALVFMTGCSTVSKVADSPEGQLVFDYAVTRALREATFDPTDVLDTVARIRAAVDTSEQDRLDAVIDELRSEVPWDEMYPEDKVLAEYVFDVAEQRIRDAAPGENLAEARASISQVLDWIETAAERLEQ